MVIPAEVVGWCWALGTRSDHNYIRYTCTNLYDSKHCAYYCS